MTSDITIILCVLVAVLIFMVIGGCIIIKWMDKQDKNAHRNNYSVGA